MNKTNLELKHHCSDFKNIRIVLKQLGAKKVIVKNQKDYFFNLPKYKEKTSPRLKLRIEANQKTLVYYERPDFTNTKDAIATVKLYNVKDDELLSFLITTLGVKGIVEKKREVWRKQNTVFHLDNVKGVGGIFEIELQKKRKITKNDRALFKSYQDKLTPFLGKVVKGSNIDLVGQKGR